MAAADARAALSRSRVVERALVHAAQAVALVLLLRAFADFAWAAAADPSILLVAVSFLTGPRISFLAANILVIVLATLFRNFAASFSPSFADPFGWPSSDGDAEHPFLAFLRPLQVTEAEPSGKEAPPPQQPQREVFVDKEAPPPQREVFVDKEAPPPQQEQEVFVDKEAVHVKTVRAQPPRRTVSEKTGGGGAAGLTARAAAPELRRAKSENARRRQRRSAAAAAAEAAPVELGTDDGEAFRRVVEAFIAKQQTWFHREESMVIARANAARGGGEDGPAIAGAAVAVK